MSFKNSLKLLDHGNWEKCLKMERKQMLLLSSTSQKEKPRNYNHLYPCEGDGIANSANHFRAH